MSEGFRFGAVPTAAIRDRRVSHAALRVLCELSTYADKDGWCYPKQKTMGVNLGITRQAVSQHLVALGALGYVEITAQNGGDGSTIQNRYRVVLDTPACGPPASPELAPPASPELAAGTPQENTPVLLEAEPSLGAESAQQEQPEKRARARNPIFDALAAVYPAGTKSEQSLCGMTAAELAKLEPPPEPAEVEARARWAKDEWPTSSPRAVAQHWTMIGERLAGSAPGRREVLERYGRNPAAWPFWDEVAMAEIRAAGLHVPERRSG